MDETKPIIDQTGALKNDVKEAQPPQTTGDTGDDGKDTELLAWCEQANRLFDKIIPTMQQAHDEIAPVYDEIRNRALAGEQLTRDDVANLKKMMEEKKGEMMRIYEVANSTKNPFIGNLLQMRVHRLFYLPFGGHGKESDYISFFDDYFEHNNDTSYLPPVTDFLTTELYVRPQDLLRTDDLGDCLETKAFLACGNRRQYNVSFEFPQEVVSVGSYHWLDSELYMEIINNAQDAMPEGGEIKIIGKISDDGKQIVISIADSGPGMSEEILNKVRQGGFTTKPHGSGNGLRLCREYVEKILHGKFEITSEEGKGTAITLTLPLAKK